MVLLSVFCRKLNISLLATIQNLSRKKQPTQEPAKIISIDLRYTLDFKLASKNYVDYQTA